jgi:hypothetical protein
MPDVDQELNDSFPASDPPSWTGAISRAAAVPASTAHAARQERERPAAPVAARTTPPPNEPIVGRIRAEFLEMPGLSLTSRQAQRLWSLEPRRCETVLNALIDSQFLRRTRRGQFVLRRPPG